jgi:hypothetical protein
MHVAAYSPNNLHAFGAFGLDGFRRTPRAEPEPEFRAKAEKAAEQDKQRLFAQEMLRRLEEHSGREREAGDREKGDSAQKLSLSLARAMDHVSEKYGREAALGVMGVFASAVGEGDVQEEALGGAMLDAVRFMDRNFGLEAGDDLVNLFNRDLNKSVNEYFDNGLSEVIYSARPGQGSPAGMIAGVLDGVAERFGAEAAETVKALMDESLADGGDVYTLLRDGLRSAKSWLEENFGADALAGLDFSLAGGNNAPRTGTLLNTAV